MSPYEAVDPGPARIAEPGIRGLCAFVALSPAILLALGAPAVVARWPPVLAAAVVGAGVALAVWVCARAWRMGVLDRDDDLVVRNLWRTNVASWSEVALMTDGAVNMGESGLGWVLRVDTRDGRRILAKATYWRACGRPRTVQELERIARRHGVRHELTGSPRLPGPAGTPVAEGWQVDPVDGSRERMFSSSRGWAPFARPSNGSDRTATGGDGAELIWDPIPPSAPTADQGGQLARRYRRLSWASGAAAMAVAGIAGALFIHRTNEPGSDYAAPTAIAWAAWFLVSGALGALGQARTWAMVELAARTAEREGRLGQCWAVVPRPRAGIRHTMVTVVVLTALVTSLSNIGGYYGDPKGPQLPFPDFAATIVVQVVLFAVALLMLAALLRRPRRLVPAEDAGAELARTPSSRPEAFAFLAVCAALALSMPAVRDQVVALGDASAGWATYNGLAQAAVTVWLGAVALMLAGCASLAFGRRTAATLAVAGAVLAAICSLVLAVAGMVSAGTSLTDSLLVQLVGEERMYSSVTFFPSLLFAGVGCLALLCTALTVLVAFRVRGSDRPQPLL